MAEGNDQNLNNLQPGNKKNDQPMNQSNQQPETRNNNQSGNKAEGIKDDLKKKGVHEANKLALDAYTGGAGGAIYEKAPKGLTDKLEEAELKRLGKMPGMGGMSKPKGQQGEDAKERQQNQTQQRGGSSSRHSPSDNQNEEENFEQVEEEEQSAFQMIFGRKSKKKTGEAQTSAELTEEVMKKTGKQLAFPVLGCCIIFITVFGLLIFSVLGIKAKADELFNISGITDKVSEFLEDAGDWFTSHFSGDDKKKAQLAEKAYFEKLEKVQRDFKKKYKVNIDTTLITATLFYGQYPSTYLGTNLPEDDGPDDTIFSDADKTKFYKTAKRHIKTLAKYQVIEEITHYVCEGEVTNTTPSAEEIANTWTGLGMSKRVINVKYDLPEPTEEYPDPQCPGDESTYTLDIKREGVYYYKLMSNMTTFIPSLNGSFIKNYYPDFVSENEQGNDTDQSKVDQEDIADGIYDEYEVFRKQQTYAWGNNSACPNGITVIPATSAEQQAKYSNRSKYPIGTFPLEEYVAGVVAAENYYYVNGNTEAMKAQVIAARSYALARTNNCTKPIRNSEEDQVFTIANDITKQVTAETAGIILTYNGQVISAEFDHFYRGGDFSCSNNMCSVTYKKLPNGERHTVSAPANKVGSIGGHGRGMSQIAANYMQDQGKTYEDILKFFYSEGVEITSLTIGGVTESTASVGTVLPMSGLGSALQAAGSSVEAYNSKLSSDVKSAGVGTRNAVVAAALNATKEFYALTGGKKIAYVWGAGHGSGKQYGYSSSFARDCSSFVSWVLYNAGFTYMDYVSGSWGSAGIKSPIAERRGIAGDLIWHSGHIAIIIGSDDKGYYTAEALGSKYGIVNHYYAYTDSRQYVVDMSEFYATHIDPSYAG